MATREFTVDEIRNSISIDKNDLDNVLIQQVDLYDYICKRYFWAINLRDKAKYLLKRADADASLEIRSEKEVLNAKVTEATITALIQVHKDYVAALSSLTDAEKEYNEWAALKESFLLRAQMLKELVSLHSSGYFIKTSSVNSENYRRRGV